MTKNNRQSTPNPSPEPLRLVRRLLRHLDARVARYPTYCDLRWLRGSARAMLGDLDGARDDLVEALRLHPQYDAALLGLAWVHANRGEKRAFASIQTSPRAQALDSSWCAHLEFQSRRRWAGEIAAMAFLDSLPPELDGAAPLRLDRFWVTLGAARLAEAATQLAAWCDAQPELETHLRAMELLRADSIDDDVSRLWARVYQGNPQVAAVLRAAALMPGADGPDRWCALHWSVAVSLDVYSYWLAAGDLHEREQEDAQAEAAFQRARDLDAERVEARLRLGRLYAAQARSEAAILEFEAAKHSAPGYPDIRYYLGLLHEDKGNVQAAETEYRTAIELNPSYAIARLALGSLLASSGRECEAVQLLEGVRQQGIDSVDLATRLATLYEHIGELEQAASARERALELASS